jgi:hypothetical protein
MFAPNWDYRIVIQIPVSVIQGANRAEVMVDNVGAAFCPLVFSRTKAVPIFLDGPRRRAGASSAGG